jgi:hypothetical protein
MTVRNLHSAFLLGLLALAALPGSAAEPLGRLFMTPEERRSLDSLREQGGDAFAPASGEASSSTTPADRRVVVNGVVRRSLGLDVVWVNGNRTGAPDAPIRLRQGPDRANRVTLEDAADGTTVRLKPGQYWEPATGLVADCQDCRPPANAAEIAPAPAPAPAEDTAHKP